MHPHAVVLIACQPSEMEVLRALVPSSASVVTATSISDAAKHIAQGVDAVICSMDFDESRMLDLVQEAHGERPEVPVLCCRVFASRISDVFLPAAAAAAFSMGVGAFIDLANRLPLFSADAAELAATLTRILG
jgi:DNA-binding NtrC family response regulator